ncbi:MAG: LysR family transcriptional regulator [Acidimicrobiales bacterium]
MQLHQLRYVVSVAEERRFTRAAARLHVAQPSVSSAVSALEHELGAALFHRARNGVVLTGAGEAFLPWARQILVDCESAAAAVRDVMGLRRGSLALGATPSLTTNLLPPVLAAFHSAYPDLEITVHEAGSQDLVRRLEAGEMDLAVVILPVERPWVATSPLIEEELVVAVSASHPLARRRHIRVGELEHVPLVMFKDGYDLREATMAACRRAGFTPTLAMQGLEMDGALALAAAGVAAAVVPELVVPPSGPLRAVRFRGGSLRRRVGLASRRDRPLSPAAQAFAAALGDHVARSRQGDAAAKAAASSALIAGARNFE